jgi:glucans biosynthesis protein
MYVIEFAGGPTAGELSADITASAGTISKVVVYENPEKGTTRLSFAHDTTGLELAELRAVLKRGDVVAGEIWLFRWTRS